MCLCKKITKALRRSRGAFLLSEDGSDPIGKLWSGYTQYASVSYCHYLKACHVRVWILPAQTPVLLNRINLSSVSLKLVISSTTGMKIEVRTQKSMQSDKKTMEIIAFKADKLFLFFRILSIVISKARLPKSEARGRTTT